HLGDRPAAIARLRTVADASAEGARARGLEGRYRAAIGDKAGASLAFARMRERVTSVSVEAETADMLREAAQFEVGRGDLLGAQRHLGVALSLRPQDFAIEEEYRRVCGRLAGSSTASGTPSGGALANAATFVPFRDHAARPVDGREGAPGGGISQR